MDISRTACSLLVAAWAAQPGASQEIPKLDYIISGDVQAVARDTADQNQSRTELGLVDVLVHGSLGDRWSTFAEAVFEFEPGLKRPEFNLERFYLQYTLSDAVNLGMGMRRTPIGSWNNAFQNARYFQPAIQRPDVMRSDDGGSILPAHDTGLWVNGRNIGPNRIAYDLMLSNGQSATPASDDNAYKALTAHVEFRPMPSQPLILGGSYRRDRVEPVPGSLAPPVSLTFTGADLRFEHPRFLFRSEYLALREKDATGQTRNEGWFVYLGVPLGEWTPYILFQDNAISMDTRVVSAASGMSMKMATLGLKYDWSGYVNFKAEYSNARVDLPLRDRNQKLALALAFSF